MKKNDYQNMMEHIQPPAGLNDRVLSAARQWRRSKNLPAPSAWRPESGGRCSGRRYAPPAPWPWWWAL